ncbi:hypothetical protein C7999DRAFT_17070, partial [Corynascus novoguineensis]
APVASPTPGNKIRPKSRYFRSSSKARHNKATSVATKLLRQDAVGIPRQESSSTSYRTTSYYTQRSPPQKKKGKKEKP